ncbi:MAG: DUF1684 domain-containing protein [Bacteroidetes bacterium]|nr:DUF1684 domain-containing protein [Bacteroidota bacterium]
MSGRTIFIGIIILIIGVVIFYSFQQDSSNPEYAKKLNDEREAKNDFMRSSDESPFGEERKNFTRLNYFPADLNYRVSARLVPIENKKVITLPTSDGLEKKYLEYAYAEFQLNKEDCKLLILEIMDDAEYRGTLFLAFADATSANETYGAGRYLDVKKTPGASSITLDFNEAYNPYCAYSEKYTCPFPPRENVLKTAVRAGEKKYHQ